MNMRIATVSCFTIVLSIIFTGNTFAALTAPVINDPVEVTDTTATLTWSSAGRGKVTYVVIDCNSQQPHSTTTKRSLTISDLTPETMYSFQVQANSKGDSVTGECLTFLTASSGGGSDPTLACNYPAFSDVPRERIKGAESEFVAPPETERTLIVNEDFDSRFSPPVETDDILGGLVSFSSDYSWIIDDMSDALNRTGNLGINVDGNYDFVDYDGDGKNDFTPNGKRWSAWYDDFLNWDTMYRVENGKLALAGVYDPQANDLTRKIPNSIDPQWDDFKLHASFLKTWARDDVNTDQEDPHHSFFSDGTKGTFSAPLYLEAKVNFSKMQTPGYRLSLWMMPATRNNGATLLTKGNEAYDGDFKNGFEVDIFEYEPIEVLSDETVCGNQLEFSWINSFATSGKASRTASGKNNFEGFEEGYCGYGNSSAAECTTQWIESFEAIALKRGDELPLINDDVWHTIGFLWESDKMQWSLNGKIVLQITDPARIPDLDVHQYLILSREMTNGLSGGDPGVTSAQYTQGEINYLPPEPGLYGWNDNSNVGAYLGQINDDKALIDYIRIYEIDP